MSKRKTVIGTFLIAALAVTLWCRVVSAEAALQSPGIESVLNESEREDSPDYSEKLKDELQGLIEELRGLEQDIWEKMQKEIIPRIREEIQKLRERLRELNPDEEQFEEKPSPPQQI